MAIGSFSPFSGIRKKIAAGGITPGSSISPGAQSLSNLLQPIQVSAEKRSMKDFIKEADLSQLETDEAARADLLQQKQEERLVSLQECRR